MQINSVKEAKNIKALTVVNFNFEKHLLYLAHAGMIKKGIYSITNESISEQTSIWEQNIYKK